MLIVEADARRGGRVDDAAGAGVLVAGIRDRRVGWRVWRRVGHDDAERRRPTGRDRRADRLVVGYDREPDTLNRFSTHILEDIETCVVEGLVTTDEKMTIVPLLAASVPTLENGGVVLRQDGGMDVTWRLRPEREVARRHAAYLGRREVHGRGDQQPGLQPREHRRLRPHHAASTRLTRSPRCCTTRRSTRPTRCSSCAARCRSTCSKAATSTPPTTTIARRSAPDPTSRRVEERRVHPARGGAELLARRRARRRSRRCSSSSSPTPTPASTS